MSEKVNSAIVDHLAIKCGDLANAVTQYENLGFKLETLYDDWAMLRDANGFGIALLPPASKHPPHLGLRVETMAELEAAAKLEGRPVKPHRDGTNSFYTKGVDGQIVEMIWYPEES